MKDIKKILFVCKFNRYRSNIALSLFKKYNNRIKAKASGVIQGPVINKKMQKVANDFKVKLIKKPKVLTERGFNLADLVVIVGDDVPKSLFEKTSIGEKRKVIVWKLKDVMQFDLSYHKKTRKLTEEIEKRIKKLVSELRNK